MDRTDSDDGHESSGVGKYWEPVEDPLSDISCINQSLAVKLGTKVSEEEHSCGSNAASKNVDNDQEGKASSSIVGQEAECIGEWNAKQSKQDDDQCKSSPSIME